MSSNAASQGLSSEGHRVRMSKDNSCTDTVARLVQGARSRVESTTTVCNEDTRQILHIFTFSMEDRWDHLYLMNESCFTVNAAEVVAQGSFATGVNHRFVTYYLNRLEQSADAPEFDERAYNKVPWSGCTSEDTGSLEDLAAQDE